MIPCYCRVLYYPKFLYVLSTHPPSLLESSRVCTCIIWTTHLPSMPFCRVLTILNMSYLNTMKTTHQFYFWADCRVIPIISNRAVEYSLLSISTHPCPYWRTGRVSLISMFFTHPPRLWLVCRLLTYVNNWQLVEYDKIIVNAFLDTFIFFPCDPLSLLPEHFVGWLPTSPEHLVWWSPMYPQHQIRSNLQSFQRKWSSSQGWSKQESYWLSWRDFGLKFWTLFSL